MQLPLVRTRKKAKKSKKKLAVEEMDAPYILTQPSDLLAGSSVILPGDCHDVPMNVEGQCIRGGIVCGGTCNALPIYLASNVAYTKTGRLAGTNFQQVAQAGMTMKTHAQ